MRVLSLIRKSAQFAATILTLASPALAQQPAEFTPALPNAAKAFTERYGQAVVAQLTSVLKASAEGQCLASRKIDDEALRQQAHEILVYFGGKLASHYAPLPSALQLTLNLMREAGDTAAVTELRQTLDHPDMRAIRAHWPAMANTNLANDVANAFNAYVRVNALPVKGVLGWAADGNTEMSLLWETLSGPPEALDQAAKVQGDDLARLMAPYQEKVQEILKAALAQIEDDHTVFAGVEERLLALCAGGKP